MGHPFCSAFARMSLLGDTTLGAPTVRSMASSASASPYARLALVCHFFASEDRVHALRAPELQGILDAVLFEPGRYLDAGLAARTPSHVPARDEDKLLLATPYGHLLNELHQSPRTVCDAVVGLQEVQEDHDLANVLPTDSVVQFTTTRYRDNPLVVKGPGAGPDVTAMGIFADLLRVASSLGTRR